MYKSSNSTPDEAPGSWTGQSGNCKKMLGYLLFKVRDKNETRTS